MTIDQITRLKNNWKAQKSHDEELKDAWANISNMMFKGNITALIGTAKLIAQMDWWNGITEWIEFTPEQYPIVSKSIHLEERALYAYVIMYCKHLSEQRSVTTWFDSLGVELDWGMMAISWLSTYSRGDTRLVDGVTDNRVSREINPHEENSKVSDASIPHCPSIVCASTEENPSMSMGLLHPVDSILV